MKTMTENRLQAQTEIYAENYEKYGYSPLSMIMPSDRRAIRYYELLKNFDFFQKADYTGHFILCDAGCGFGDINGYLRRLGFQSYSYIGLDVVDAFMEDGRQRYGNENVRYLKRNFINEDLSNLQFDYAVSSQTFTIPYSDTNENYEVIFEAVERLFRQCRKGVSFNFFTDQGDYQRPDAAYHNPSRLLEFAYSLSNRVVLDNACFPYECTLTILKDTERKKNGMVFDSFMDVHEKEFQEGIFVAREKT
ncbi:MAG: class I SAM-dependent methyltransferase [Lachnospiraceae bacterium]|nr:class I SAM-dependent methyltransferase [Lachnospiraceae bacterium]